MNDLLTYSITYLLACLGCTRATSDELAETARNVQTIREELRLIKEDFAELKHLFASRQQPHEFTAFDSTSAL